MGANWIFDSLNMMIRNAGGELKRHWNRGFHSDCATCKKVVMGTHLEKNQREDCLALCYQTCHGDKNDLVSLKNIQVREV